MQEIVHTPDGVFQRKATGRRACSGIARFFNSCKTGCTSAIKTNELILYCVRFSLFFGGMVVALQGWWNDGMFRQDARIHAKTFYHNTNDVVATIHPWFLWFLFYLIISAISVLSV